MEKKIFKCVIVDDESHAIVGLSSYIKRVPYLCLIGTYQDPLSALMDIKKMDFIDLLLLDVDMPEISGIELASIVRSKVGKLVLTTAHTKYGYEGFQIRADDYLLKPYSLASFIEIMDRMFNSGYGNNSMIALPHPNTQGNEDFFFIKSKDDDLKLMKVRYRDVILAESKLNYVQLHIFSGKAILTYMSLTEMSRYLNITNGFIQFQRSFILNKSRIEHIDGNTVTMDNGKQVTVGDYYKRDFSEFVSTYLIKGKRRSQ